MRGNCYEAPPLSCSGALPATSPCLQGTQGTRQSHILVLCFLHRSAYLFDHCPLHRLHAVLAVALTNSAQPHTCHGIIHSPPYELWFLFPPWFTKHFTSWGQTLPASTYGKRMSSFYNGSVLKFAYIFLVNLPLMQGARFCHSSAGERESETCNWVTHIAENFPPTCVF